MDSNILPYILGFAVITMAVVFGFRSWMLSSRLRSNRRFSQSGRSSRRERTQGSRHSGSLHRFSRSGRRHSSRSSRYYRDDHRGNRSDHGRSSGGPANSSPPDSPPPPAS